MSQYTHPWPAHVSTANHRAPFQLDETSEDITLIEARGELGEQVGAPGR